jgi:hypothetical protein
MDLLETVITDLFTNLSWGLGDLLNINPWTAFL